MFTFTLDRTSKIERMDEWEEWTILAKHYCFAYAWTSRLQEMAGSDFFANQPVYVTNDDIDASVN